MTNFSVSSPLSTAIWAELSRRHPGDPYAWTMAHRSMNGAPPIHMPAIAAIMRDTHERVAIQKSAQVGATELLVNMALWAADTGYAGRGNVLYALPTHSQMEDFA